MQTLMNTTTPHTFDLSAYLGYRIMLGGGELLIAVILYFGGIGTLVGGVLTAVSVLTLSTSAWALRAWGTMRHERAPASVARVTLLLLCDLVLLTIFLCLSGGPSNPFSILYLIQITMAALLLRGRMVWLITLVASLAYGLLFWFHHPLPPHLGGHHMMGEPGASMHHDHSAMLHEELTNTAQPSQNAFSVHLQGMWLAFSLTATLLVLLIERMNRMIDRERARADRSSRLLGLTTLAAGAAHELGSPLATIKVASGELRFLIEHAASHFDPSLRDELLQETSSIDEELRRARHIIDRMSLDAGALQGEQMRHLDGNALLEVLSLKLPEHVTVLTTINGEALCDVMIVWPVDAIATMLKQLVRNAQDANATHITLTLTRTPSRLITITLEDDGDGLQEEFLDRYGEPFFTTKPEGKGMGLGVFLSITLCEQLGGRFTLTNRPAPEHGCRATIVLPPLPPGART